MICPQDGQRIIRPDGMRISSAPISGGYAVWQDNVRPLAELHARLNENRAEMERNRKKLRDAYLVQRSLHELTEKNRIYNELEAKHGRQTAQMRQMLARCEGADPAERRSLLKRVLLPGTYIKRSANLYFLSSEYQRLPQQELRLTVDGFLVSPNVEAAESEVIDLGFANSDHNPVRMTFRLMDAE